MFSTTMNATLNAKLQQIKSADRFLLLWNLSSLVTLVLPLLVFTIARATSDGDGEEEGDSGDYDEYGNYVGSGHWWQFWKSSNNNQNNNDDEQQDGDEEDGAPWWCK
jgi:hypothetical protein